MKRIPDSRIFWYSQYSKCMKFCVFSFQTHKVAEIRTSVSAITKKSQKSEQNVRIQTHSDQTCVWNPELFQYPNLISRTRHQTMSMLPTLFIEVLFEIGPVDILCKKRFGNIDPSMCLYFVAVNYQGSIIFKIPWTFFFLISSVNRIIFISCTYKTIKIQKLEQAFTPVL